jgi:CBS domain-containing protein
MNVERLMTRNVRTCKPEDTLNHAARILWESDCGCIPIVSCEDEKLVGIITDRDICMAAYTQGRTLAEMRVEGAMSPRAITCDPDVPIAAAEEIMQSARVRRLPVVDEVGQLLGLISLADIAREAARNRKSRKKEIKDAEVGQTLSVICEPRGFRPQPGPRERRRGAAAGGEKTRRGGGTVLEA